MKIYTKTGDKGLTSLYTGERVEKNSLRVQVYGAIDEADSALGLARAFVEVEAVKEKIFLLQKNLPKLMADFASLNREPTITFDDVKNLESEMDALENLLPPLREFIIPGNSKGGAFLDLARTITRRAERLSCELSKSEPVHEADKIFLNRLSDYCFLLMRREDLKL
ncbi:MAG: cob(I)yrinic acid a,c-diamide adenosyltransferase [Selenomonadaceae bacterium]|nr:cob(I)yrinic acid a,c-diamide adenosyltransferase [Selenomonadaceae bacterium]